MKSLYLQTLCSSFTLFSRSSLIIIVMYFTVPKLCIQLLLLVALQSSTCSAQAFSIFGPLFDGVTSFTLVTSTTTSTKPTPCFITAGKNVTQCRRKRGIEEKQQIIHFDAEDKFITPSAVMG